MTMHSQLASLFAAHQANRPDLIKALKDWLTAQRATLQTGFEAHAGKGNLAGEQYARGHAAVMDALLTAMFTYAFAGVDQAVSLVATGGTGRAELCPGSDIDLMILFESQPDSAACETFLYLGWDIGLKLGHAVRTLPEMRKAAGEDHTVLTTLLEARLIAGDQPLFTRLAEGVWSLLEKERTRWIAAKMAERRARHEAAGDSRYLVTPNVKEGKGGLRDLHTLFWLMKATHRVDSVREMVQIGSLEAAEERHFMSAWRFLLRVRVALHLVTGGNRPGRGDDRLGFEHQPHVAALLGYVDDAEMRGVERFMRDYFGTARQVGSLTRIFCTALALDHDGPTSQPPRKLREVEGFAITAGRLELAAPDQFEATPADRIRIFAVAARHGLDIHPEALKTLSRLPTPVPATLRNDRNANRLFLSMLTSREISPEPGLRLFAEAGMMGAFLPDFGQVQALMQWDTYHHYTVDEHTLRAIGILHALEAGEMSISHRLPSQLVHKLQSRRALYVAVLLHDIAKGRGGAHEVLGADLAADICPRLGLDAQETDTVVWAVRWHLLMSETAFRRDLHDPRTVGDFAETVQSVERLRLLTVLTAVDITAVGPGTWTEWKAALLEQLFAIAELALTGGMAADAIDARAAEMQQATRALLPHWSQSGFDEYARHVPPGLWLAFEPGEQAEIARIVDLSRRENRHLSVEFRQNARTGLTDIIIHTADRIGLFADIVAAIGAARLSTVQARIFTLEDETVLDVFSVATQEGQAVTDPGRLARISSQIARLVEGGKADLSGLYATRRPTAPEKAMDVPPRVIIDNQASARFTVIEINAKDRPGLLHDISRTMVDEALILHSAKIATYGAKAIDTFYVQDIFGTRITQPDKLKRLHKNLLTAIQPPEGWQ